MTLAGKLHVALTSTLTSNHQVSHAGQSATRLALRGPAAHIAHDFILRAAVACDGDLAAGVIEVNGAAFARCPDGYTP